MNENRFSQILVTENKYISLVTINF
jgi:hypothetical protein